MEQNSGVEYFVDGRPDFDALLPEYQRINGDIARQNEAYEELIVKGVLTVGLIRSRTLVHLSNTQASSLAERSALPTEQAFDYLIEKEKYLRDALAWLAMELVEAEKSQLEDVNKIHDEEQLVLSRLPAMKDVLDQIVPELIDETQSSQEVECIQQQIKTVQQEINEFEVIYEKAGTAWPVPIKELSTDADKAPDLGLVIDTFPEPPRTERSNTQIAEDVKRKYPENVLNDASAFVAYFLAEEPGRIYSYQDLALALYNDNDRLHTKRIAPLISAYNLDKTKIIGNILAENGLVLQKGNRQNYNPSSEQAFGRKTAVLRAVKKEYATITETIIHQNEYIHWQDSNWEIVDSPEVIMPKQPELETSDTVAQGDLNVQIGNVLEDPAMPADVKPRITATSTLKTPSKVPEKHKWQTEFIESAMDEIQKFENANLMISNNPIGKELVQMRLGSAKSGTDKMLQKALSVRIINQDDKQGNRPLKIWQYICMHLQDRHQEIFSNTRRRKQAIKIVQDLVNDYFATQNR